MNVNKNFKMDEDKRLYYLKDMNWSEVDLKSCFPLSSPDKYFSIINKEGVELGIVEALSDLEKSDSDLLESYFKFKQLNYIILGVYNVDEDFGLRHFEVKTQLGDKVFQTSLDAWPIKSRSGDIIFTDIYGDQFWVKDLEFGEKFIKSLI